MADPAPSASEEAVGGVRYLTFCVGPQLYALPAQEVAEVIRVPALARLPQGPPGLLGLGNLRGSVLPVASARGLLGHAEQPPSRAIVLSGPAAAALAVDSVEALVTVEARHLETGQAQLAAQPGERLRGVFRAAAGGEVVKVLDVWPLLEAAFTPTARPSKRDVAASSAVAVAGPEQRDVQRLVTFDVADQEFALPLADVQEVIQVPEHVARGPRAESLVLGLASNRGSLLPLLSLRGLLGLPAATTRTGREKVLVVPMGQTAAGLVVDAMRSIVPADPSLIEPTPPMLLARTGGETRIAAIFRGDEGRRLISILSKQQLFREDVMQRLQRTGPELTADVQAEETRAAGLQFVVFRLGEEEFALPIEAVEEVARAPDRITRVPKAPEFLEGVINLRGEVLPVVDQRRRFEMPEADDREARRLLVVRTERHRAGLIVDGVSEVLRSAEDDIDPAPELAGEAKRLVYGVLNRDGGDRLVLLLDPAELLTRSERGLLDAFAAEARQAAS